MCLVVSLHRQQYMCLICPGCVLPRVLGASAICPHSQHMNRLGCVNLGRADGCFLNLQNLVDCVDHSRRMPLSGQYLAHVLGVGSQPCLLVHELAELHLCHASVDKAVLDFLFVAGRNGNLLSLDMYERVYYTVGGSTIHRT